MKFELNEYHRNVSDQELISDVIDTAKKLNKRKLTIKEYKNNGKYNVSTLIRRFSTWNKVLTNAGLEISHQIVRNHNRVYITNGEIIEDMVLTAKFLNKTTLKTAEYSTHGKYGHSIACFRFGSWDEALKAANLDKTGFYHKIDTLELFEEIERIWILLGRQPTYTDMRQGVSKFSAGTFANRFGSWRGTLEAFVKYINSDDDHEYDNKLNMSSVDKSELSTQSEKGTCRKHLTNRNINLRLRFLVMKRDNFKCCACGASPAKDSSVELHIDHIIPWAKGGETVLENLQTLCSKCNLGKSDIL